jgi:hypothetical protein
MTAPNTYRINTLQDFLKVPSDRLADCLSEFAGYLDILRSLTGSVEGVTWKSTFVWVDDGRRDLSVKLTVTTVRTTEESQ